MMRHCGVCHDCGAELRLVLDGEEYCPNCKTYHHYRSHGWQRIAEGGDECPGWCQSCGGKLDEFEHKRCIDCLREEAAAVAEDFAREVS